MESRQHQRTQRERRRLSTLLIAAGVLVLVVPLTLSLRNRPLDNPVIAAAAPEDAGSPPGPAGVQSRDRVSTTGESATTEPPSTVSARSEASAPAADTTAVAGEAPLFTLAIDRIGISYPVLEGVDNPQLAQGPGHYSNTSQPGTGNAAIAGHRTIRGKPAFFYAINRLEPGDPIRIIYPDRTLTFQVEKVFFTGATDLSVIAPTDYPALTLTTCDPPGTDERRLIVRARLVENP
jgi:sortase A